MKRMNLILILVIGLFATMAIADPGPVTDMVLPDLGFNEVALIGVGMEVEFARAPSLDDNGLVTDIASFEYIVYAETAYSTPNYYSNIDLGYIAKAKHPARMNGKELRVLECRSQSCT